MPNRNHRSGVSWLTLSAGIVALAAAAGAAFHVLSECRQGGRRFAEGDQSWGSDVAAEASGNIVPAVELEPAADVSRMPSMIDLMDISRHRCEAACAMLREFAAQDAPGGGARVIDISGEVGRVYLWPLSEERMPKMIRNPVLFYASPITGRHHYACEDGQLRTIEPGWSSLNYGQTPEERAVVDAAGVPDILAEFSLALLPEALA